MSSGHVTHQYLAVIAGSQHIAEQLGSPFNAYGMMQQQAVPGMVAKQLATIQKAMHGQKIARLPAKLMLR